MILVVDDDKVVNTVTASLLRSNKFEVICAYGGQEAIDTYAQNQTAIKLVVLDLSMPDMGGLEVFKVLRSMNPEIPVVFASGYAANEEIAQINLQGKSGFLQKPYSRTDLTAIVEKLLA